MWCRPSDSTTCCAPAASLTTVNQRSRRAGSMPSGSPGAVGSAATLSVPGSRWACQMIRASGAATSGRSAKVNPPQDRIVDRPAAAARCTACRAGRPDVPRDIIGIATKPLPHQSGAIDAAQPGIGLGIAPGIGAGRAAAQSHGGRITPDCSEMDRYPATLDNEYNRNILDSSQGSWHGPVAQAIIKSSVFETSRSAK